jgi:tRNA-splicing ligase RtcB
MQTLRFDVAAPVKAWTEGVPVEDLALQQVANVARLPFIYSHVAIMPDVHWGLGATVGSVIATKGAIVPAAVGVDIGCGMIATRTSLAAADLPDSLSALRSAIEDAVPHGRSDRGGANDCGAWREDRDLGSLRKGLTQITHRYPKLQRAAERAGRHLGTLGTGNHFIEICLDEAGHVWIMLHSGSRGIGNAIGTRFIELAKQDMRRLQVNLPDADLAYLPDGSTLFDDYVYVVEWAQAYAAENRRHMLHATLAAVSRVLRRPVTTDTEAVNCHHNYVAREHHFGDEVLVTRKGAVRARRGDLGIIPGSMGARSYIVRGKGNADSFCSCSHGAGRAMSRNEAKRRYTLADHISATDGVECRKDAAVIDETPMAYKSIDAVMTAQNDLVDVVHILKQVICVKG